MDHSLEPGFRRWVGVIRLQSVATVLAIAFAVCPHARAMAAPALTDAETALAGDALARPDFKQVVNRIAPSVVGVLVRRKSMEQRPLGEVSDDDLAAEVQNRLSSHDDRGAHLAARHGMGLGSGFITSDDGYVVTNAHVVTEAEGVTVKLNDRRELPARIVGVDKDSDIALLKIDARGLPPVRIGSAQQMQVGQWVLAIGTPFGFERTVTQGIVSALGRSLPGQPYVPFIQTDVPINPGNSGGPLFDDEGRVVGINSQIYSGSGGYMGLSFAIPIDVALAVVDQLRATGKVARGYLGLNIQDLDQDLAAAFGLERPHGALIGTALPDGPAARGGLQAGDIIVQYDDAPVEDAGRLRALIAGSMPGRPVSVMVVRAGLEHSIAVTVGLAPEPTVAGDDPGAAATTAGTVGTVVSDVDPFLRRQLGMPQGGVVVVKVGAGPLAEGGIRSGDVLLALDGVVIRDTGHFRTLLEHLPPEHPVALMVVREGVTGFVALKPPAPRPVSLRTTRPQ